MYTWKASFYGAYEQIGYRPWVGEYLAVLKLVLRFAYGQNITNIFKYSMQKQKLQISFTMQSKDTDPRESKTI